MGIVKMGVVLEGMVVGTDTGFNKHGNTSVGQKKRDGKQKQGDG